MRVGINGPLGYWRLLRASLFRPNSFKPRHFSRIPRLNPIPRSTFRQTLFSTTTALAFTEFDEPDDSGDTREQRMLKFSNDEKDAEPETVGGKILAALSKWIWEPLCTLFRFGELLVIFMPVLLAMPITLLGFKHEDGGDRSGAMLWYRYLTWSMELAGPSFIKLGQWAASRTDIFPESMCNEMGKLHSNARQHSFRYTRRAIHKAFGKSMEEIFSAFDRTPIGVGAMGQAYRATLIDGDQEVVVKILHPAIDRMVRRDLTIMRIFADFVNALPTMEWLSLPGEVHTFGVMMTSQLDLRIEAENLRIFRENFEGRSSIHFPTPFPELTTRHILVEELIKAVPMEKILKYCTHSPMDTEVASLGLDAFLKMLLLDNFIHADLHPGNIMVRFHKTPLKHEEKARKEMDKTTDALMRTKTKEEWNEVWSDLESRNYSVQVVFIDAGLVTELNKTNRRNFIDLFKAIAIFDGFKAGELMVERSRTPEQALNPEVFALRTQHLVDTIKKRTFALGSVRLGDLLTAMLQMVRKHHVRMESDFITVVLSILLLEGIGRQLNPNLDLFKQAIPILREVGQSSTDITIGFNEDTVQMLKVWMVLEARQFIQASIEDIHRCVKYDRLSPNE